jgi:hypothetical protein
MDLPVFQSWLKWRVRREALGYVLVGVAGALASLFVLSVTFYITFFVLLWGSSHVFALFELVGWKAPAVYSLRHLFLIASLLFVALLFIGNATASLEYLGRIPRVSWSSRLGPQTFDAAAKLITDLLFTGPRLVVGVLKLFQRAGRLSKFDARSGAGILALLASKDSRVSFREICDQISGINPTRDFPQLRDVEGVLFLTKDPTGLGLTADFRAELRAVMGSVEPVEELQSDTSPGPETASVYESCCVEEHCYQILGITSSASLAEARAAYRRLMKEHHPDRLAGLGNELQDLAQERAKQINQAYEDICAKFQHGHAA